MERLDNMRKRMSGSLDALHVSALQENDIAPLIQEMRRLNAKIAGLNSPRSYRRLLRDALDTSDITVVVARDGEQPVAFVVCVTDWPHFKRQFVRRYPALGLELLVSRLLHRVRSPRSKLRPSVPLDSLVMEQDPCGAQWGDPGSSIAVTVFVGVLPEYRGRGIFQQLYRVTQEELWRQGVRRLDAHMNVANVASIRAHAKAGWRVSKDASGVFATIDLSQGEVGKGADATA